MGLVLLQGEVFLLCVGQKAVHGVSDTGNR